MMTKTLIAGIDPGLDGAIALFGPGTLQVHDMPTLDIKTNGKNRRQLDIYKLAGFFELYGPSISLACIEDPSSMPSDGVIQAFKFGFNCACAQMAAACSFIPMRLVRPATWKAKMGLTGDKDRSRQLASQVMPRFSHLWPLKKHDGRAEAALLAVYGSRL